MKVEGGGFCVVKLIVVTDVCRFVSDPEAFWWSDKIPWILRGTVKNVKWRNHQFFSFFTSRLLRYQTFGMNRSVIPFQLWGESSTGGG